MSQATNNQLLELLKSIQEKVDQQDKNIKEIIEKQNEEFKSLKEEREKEIKEVKEKLQVVNKKILQTKDQKVKDKDYFGGMKKLSINLNSWGSQ